MSIFIDILQPLLIYLALIEEIKYIVLERQKEIKYTLFCVYLPKKISYMFVYVALRTKTLFM